jgi:ribosome modulation factor
MESLGRDARKLLPRSLARLMAEREPLMNDEARRFPATLSQALAADLSTGELRPETLAALEAEGAAAVDLLRRQYLTAGLIRLGGVLRIPADLADPVLAAGGEGYPPGVAREYYAFIEANLGKIPVVVDGESTLALERRELPGYWRGLLGRSRLQAPVIRTGLFRDGRVVDHRTIDFRSPVFGVAQIAYSRAVTAIAGTWLALWRDAHGDLTRMPKPRVVKPEERP